MRDSLAKCLKIHKFVLYLIYVCENIGTDCKNV